MSGGRVAAVVFHPAADPRTAPPGTEPHLIHDEIPAVESALRAAGWQPLLVPAGGDPLEVLAGLRRAAPAVVVNLCEDLGGDSAQEMHFTAALALLGLPFTGAPPLALGLCRDKVLVKRIARSLGVPTPPFTVCGAGDGEPSPGGLAFPLIAKPAHEDGSLGIGDDCVAHDADSLLRAVRRLRQRYGDVLVEEFVDGREVNVPVLGGSPPRVLPASEIDFTALPPGLPRICGYESKWVGEDPRYRATTGVCPAPLDGDTRERLEAWSLSLYAALGLRGCARFDWRLSPRAGPMLLEANPNPDLGTGAGFVRSLRAAGLDYPDLVAALVADATRNGPPGG